MIDRVCCSHPYRQLRSSVELVAAIGRDSCSDRQGQLRISIESVAAMHRVLAMFCM